ncbi:MAG: hypothetical protein GTO63_30225 [Anaerolineae bacterium]|nr:hypothetical protein [Anaerolineae bacterium]NIN98982.1 hypothetical protein [Anaerolineae bacterium]
MPQKKGRPKSAARKLAERFGEDPKTPGGTGAVAALSEANLIKEFRAAGATKEQISRRLTARRGESRKAKAIGDAAFIKRLLQEGGGSSRRVRI